MKSKYDEKGYREISYSKDIDAITPMSVSEVSNYMKISEESVRYYATRKRELSFIRLGKRLIFRKNDVDEFLEKKLQQGFVA